MVVAVLSAFYSQQAVMSELRGTMPFARWTPVVAVTSTFSHSFIYTFSHVIILGLTPRDRWPGQGDISTRGLKMLWVTFLTCCYKWKSLSPSPTLRVMKWLAWTAVQRGEQGSHGGSCSCTLPLCTPCANAQEKLWANSSKWEDEKCPL